MAEVHGLALLEAFQQLTDPGKWERYEQAGGQWEHLGALWEDLRAKLLSGQVFATGYCDSIKTERIEAGAWWVLAPLDLPDLKESIVRGAGRVVEGVRIHERPEQAAARAQEHCRAWLQSLAKQGEKPMKKVDLHEEAQERFPGLTRKSFDAIWRADAPKSWKQPGAPKRDS